MNLPPEFLQPEELAGMTGCQQRAAWRRWLDRIGVRYVPTPNGYPLVYRDRLIPQEGAAAGGSAVLNLEALRGPCRTAKKR